MKGKLSTRSRPFQLLVTARLIPVLIGISFLPIASMASQEPSAHSECRQSVTSTRNNIGGPLIVTMKELEKHPEDFYGKTVTVDGEMHRTFTDKVFTIEDDRFFDRDILVISMVPMEEAVTGLDEDHSIKKGKDVRVTGVVQPYNREKLECAYGPLQLESREGHSFTKNPVLIVGSLPVAKLEMPPLKLKMPPLRFQKPILPAPAPVPALPKLLPRTAGELPLLALAGLIALCGSIVKLRKG